jgi:hypothetical protein
MMSANSHETDFEKGPMQVASLHSIGGGGRRSDVCLLVPVPRLLYTFDSIF